jgi:succinate-semialdehyde dehydrogenase/glutarate-semialdehyde dehydrogenase
MTAGARSPEDQRLSAEQWDHLAHRVFGSGPALPVHSPFDGRLLTQVPTSTASEVAAAADLARAAQGEWAARPVEERAQVLLDFHDQLLSALDRIVDLLQLESGKSRVSASEEVLHVAVTARYYGRTARRYLHPERGRGMFPLLTRIDRYQVAKGLVGVIAPWNYPLTMAISDGLAALVAGNAVLLKPDARTPLVSLAAVELLERSGMPAGLWQVVNGEGDRVGPAVIDQSDYVCFTGSTRTGRVVAARCADRLIGCSLELGGKNPMLILDDVDVAAAAAGAVRASFANAGQLCVAAERIYVHQSVFDQFCSEFTARTNELVLGRGLAFDYDMGCLISTSQLDRVVAHVEDARSQGAQVLTGGRQRPDLGPLFYEPTILTGVTPTMACCTEETFGPVVSLFPVADEAEAIARANESEYGLNASVWTSDPARGRRVAARIRCGTVNVNEGFAASFGSIDAPMGGMKSSGIGRRQGKEGLRRFVDVQSVATQSLIPIAPSLGLSARGYVAAMVGALRVLKRSGRA